MRYWVTDPVPICSDKQALDGRKGVNDAARLRGAANNYDYKFLMAPVITPHSAQQEKDARLGNFEAFLGMVYTEKFDETTKELLAEIALTEDTYNRIGKGMLMGQLSVAMPNIEVDDDPRLGTTKNIPYTMHLALIPPTDAPAIPGLAQIGDLVKHGRWMELSENKTEIESIYMLSLQRFEEITNNTILPKEVKVEKDKKIEFQEEAPPEVPPEGEKPPEGETPPEAPAVDKVDKAFADIAKAMFDAIKAGDMASAGKAYTALGGFISGNAGGGEGMGCTTDDKNASATLSAKPIESDKRIAQLETELSAQRAELSMQKKKDLVNTEFNAGWLSKAASDKVMDEKVTLEEARKLCEFAHIGYTTPPYDGTGRFDMSRIDIKTSPKDVAALTTSEAWHNASDVIVEAWLKAQKTIDPATIDRDMIAKTRATYELHFAKKETEKALSL